MFTAKELSVGYGDEPLFEAAEFTLNPGERIGVVGPNGVGKSTLLRALHGDIAPISGSVNTDSQVGYLAQVPDAEEPVASYFDRMSGGLLTVGRELDSLYEAMGNNPDDETLSERLGELQTRFDEGSGYELQSRIDEVLSKLGAPSDALGKRFGELSGGQQSRVLLAGQLIQAPDVLLLDEPTNNLDTEGLKWLEGYLSKYKGALMVVSHDREFLDNTVTKIIELDGTKGELQFFQGGFTDYRDESARRFAALVQKLEAQEKREKALDDAIDQSRRRAAQMEGSSSAFYRAKGATVARRAKAMEHRLERMKADPQQLGLQRPEQRRRLPLNLSGESVRGRSMVGARALRLGYGLTEPILDDVNFMVQGQDRLAIVGDNGAGKTTLLRALAGNESLIQTGTVELHSELSLLSQTDTHTAIKQSEHTLVEWFRREVGEIYEDDAQSLLVWFGFDGNQLKQPVKRLSPGEVNKLSLLAMTYSGRDLLMLDEPTNHLDFDALDVVEHVLDAANYKGTLVVVSHDRKFLGNLACNRVLIVGAGRVKEDLNHPLLQSSAG